MLLFGGEGMEFDTGEAVLTPPPGETPPMELAADGPAVTLYRTETGEVQTLPMEDYLRILDEHGFEGTFTPELWGNTYSDDPDSAMRKCMEFLRAHAE